MSQTRVCSFLMSFLFLDSRWKIGPYLGYGFLMGEEKRMAKPHDGAQSSWSAVASVPFAHILLVKASHRAQLHISGQRSVLSRGDQWAGLSHLLTGRGRRSLGTKGHPTTSRSSTESYIPGGRITTYASYKTTYCKKPCLMLSFA